MAAMRTVPRFLLPQLSWTPRAASVLVAASLAGLTVAGCGPTGGIPPEALALRRAIGRIEFAGTLCQPALRRAFHASAALGRDHHFDTLKFVQRLQSEGFTEDQSVAMMKVLNDVDRGKARSKGCILYPKSEKKTTRDGS